MRFSAHISWLFRELPYLERPGAARAAYDPRGPTKATLAFMREPRMRALLQ